SWHSIGPYSFVCVAQDRHLPLHLKQTEREPKRIAVSPTSPPLRYTCGATNFVPRSGGTSAVPSEQVVPRAWAVLGEVSTNDPGGFDAGAPTGDAGGFLTAQRAFRNRGPRRLFANRTGNCFTGNARPWPQPSAHPGTSLSDFAGA